MRISKTTSRKAVAKAIAKQEGESQKIFNKHFTQDQIQDAVRLKAYELYLQRGCQHGNDLQDWVTAEQIVLEQAVSH